MKNSTTKNSFSARGVVFLSKKYNPVIITVQKWESLKKPTNCFIYDTAFNLIAAGIPICDAINVEGRWIRLPVIKEPEPFKHKKHPKIRKKPIAVSKIPLTESTFITVQENKRKKLK